MKRNTKKIVYDISISVLALISVILVFLDIYSVISLAKQPYRTLDLAMLGIFWVDYVIRFIISKNKLDFFKNNIFYLIAIIPLNEFFSLFRVTRLFWVLKFARVNKVIKVTRLVRTFGFIGVIKKKLSKFFKTNNFIYMIYCSVTLLLISSAIISYVENQSFLDSLWWSIVTCTTVGYGEISPHSTIGRIVAVILMLFGIGFIGMLTSTITSYFTGKYENKNNSKEINNDLIETINTLNLKQQKQLLGIAKELKNRSITLTVNFENTKELSNFNKK